MGLYMKKIRYAFIGSGLMAREHLECAKRIPEIEIVAVADSYEESSNLFSKNTSGMNIRYFDNHRDMLDYGEFDAVIIATPNYLHVEHVLDVISTEKHILCEKPAGISEEDILKLEEALKSFPKIYQVGLECRFVPVMRKVKELIAQGTIGRLWHLRCHEYRPPFYSKIGQWIHFKEKSGGVFVEKMCHHFDLLNWYADSRPVRVSAFASLSVNKSLYGITPNVNDNGHVIVEYENGVLACASLCMFSHGINDPKFVAIGDKKRLCGLWESSQIEMFDSDSGAKTSMEVLQPDPMAYGHGGGSYYSHKAFVDAIINGKESPNPFKNAKWSVLVTLAVEKSVSEKRTVEI
jgi:predicted dehydrogenase